MKAYLAILSSRFLALLQYRAAAVAGVCTQLFFGLVRVMIFDGFYRSSSGPQPMTYDQVVTYIWLGQAMLALSGVDLVLECSGLFTDRDKAALHIAAGAKKVIISAPAKSPDITICYGVNHQAYRGDVHHIVSNASCTTNCLAPVAKVLNDRFGIRKGLLTTVHAYTNTQRLQDLGAKDLRDARAAAQNIVPSETGAAKAVGLVIPELVGKFGGMAFRVPTPTVSVVDFTATLEKEATKESIRAAMLEYAAGRGKGILDVSDAPLVSSDLRGTTFSSVFSSMDTLALGDLVKVVAWYDNEWGYASRLADLVARVGAAALG